MFLEEDHDEIFFGSLYFTVRKNCLFFGQVSFTVDTSSSAGKTAWKQA